ncbi:helix-turn-helix transcriptional regulator [Halomonas dongshanensis]|uniref:AraC family transcriptional regulator n=1 Tax=Halomonas dongshanensis TaxID=2890835 RepID=A0ABT2EGG3_9GAMM|nr:AraC family transcriptional regulator [Halomonas dongshanensis]MCS2610677.1 AraC family transcriptional regulator [Halomonas dongshanensis]
MRYSNPITVQKSLETAGAKAVRSLRLPSGIVLSEWTGYNTLTEYNITSENVLSIYLSEGENCSQIRGKRVVSRGFKDAICLFPRGEGKSVWRITNRLNFLHIYFDPRCFNSNFLQSMRQAPERCHFREVFQESVPVISSAARSLAQADWTDQSISLGIDSLMCWILQNTFYHFAEEDLECLNQQGRLSVRQAGLIRDYLDENLGERILLDDLAGLVNLSRFHFLRKFKNTFGQSPHAYLTQLRMSKAHGLLQKTDEKVAMIALELGYAQHSQFTSAFKLYYGYPPAALRKRIDKNKF